MIWCYQLSGLGGLHLIFLEEDALEFGYYCRSVDGIGSSYYYTFYEFVFLFILGHFVLESGFGCWEAASQTVYFIA